MAMEFANHSRYMCTQVYEPTQSLNQHPSLEVSLCKALWKVSKVTIKKVIDCTQCAQDMILQQGHRPVTHYAGNHIYIFENQTKTMRPFLGEKSTQLHRQPYNSTCNLGGSHIPNVYSWAQEFMDHRLQPLPGWSFQTYLTTAIPHFIAA